MIGSRVSQTSLATAAARAAHLIVDEPPWLFRDPMAGVLLGKQADRLLSQHRTAPARPALAALRALVTCRARYTEDALAAAVERGIDQYVVLGAGLDTFAYRSPLARRVRVFEVDHPATQGWKRHLLSASEVPLPDELAFVPVDLRLREPLVDRLAAGGFDPCRPAFVSWLGVVPYLEWSAVAGTLAAVAALAAGTELVVEYVVPRGRLDRTDQRVFDACMLAATVAGEPWLSLTEPQRMATALRSRGFGPVLHVPQDQMVDADLWQRGDVLRPTGLTAIAYATL